jgi:hypothetical protein
LKELCLFIVDEVSTIDAGRVCAIDAHLKFSMASEDNFGGVAMIFLGAFNQLPAVGCDSPPLSLMQVAHLLHESYFYLSSLLFHLLSKDER